MKSHIYYWLKTNGIDIIIFCDYCDQPIFDKLVNISKEFIRMQPGFDELANISKGFIGMQPDEVKKIIDNILKDKKLPYTCEVGKGGISFYRIKYEQ